MRIISVKRNEDHPGPLPVAIIRAREINDEYQPAYGVQVEDRHGRTVYDSEVEARGGVICYSCYETVEVEPDRTGCGCHCPECQTTL